ncbi:unnamed protein product [Aphanomyces euteiches]|uniref:Uncharacterized protein n=1 Tax=Aphanomyces euteiches TaxID=100861 RepID=A0A6G0WCL4_9STRA|nr:hypothetical protein Ae201684_016744 [Aphanomyces euteiches]KAH9083138.1 hypothetical protein Ae201684P_014036 [Aphanomyces euteiches]KAH9135279.1 hypothetical protein AeRB84_019252 [Aphanomyces euteiches]KAH9147599.1 hypothetical protein AeRB84_008839 [Aphanomyces euteiches]KAH9148950.1 hypothetical protein AeRB84_007844 [Aphanomyces euteiches]
MSPRVKSTMKAMLSDAATFPLLGSVVFAFGLVVVAGAHCLVTSPDVRFRKTKRENPIYTSESAARAFTAHRHGFAMLSPNPINTDESFRTTNDDDIGVKTDVAWRK